MDADGEVTVTAPHAGDLAGLVSYSPNFWCDDLSGPDLRHAVVAKVASPDAPDDLRTCRTAAMLPETKKES